MRRIGLWFTGTVMIVVLLFSYRTSTSGPQVVGAPIEAGPQAPGVVGAAPAPQVAVPSPKARAASPRAGAPTPKAGAASPSARPRPARSSATPAPPAVISVNGSVASTRWGPVQVQVKISGRRIIDVTALAYPTGNGHDAQVNAYALPRLRQQVLAAQSASIHGVSGATVTSGGYRRSLQSALDAAHFGG